MGLGRVSSVLASRLPCAPSPSTPVGPIPIATPARAHAVHSSRRPWTWPADDCKQSQQHVTAPRATQRTLRLAGWHGAPEGERCAGQCSRAHTCLGAQRRWLRWQRQGAMGSRGLGDGSSSAVCTAQAAPSGPHPHAPVSCYQDAWRLARPSGGSATCPLRHCCLTQPAAQPSSPHRTRQRKNKNTAPSLHTPSCTSLTSHNLTSGEMGRGAARHSRRRCIARPLQPPTPPRPCAPPTHLMHRHMCPHHSTPTAVNH